MANNVASVCMGLKVWPVSNYTQQVPTLLWFHANGRNKSQHCWAQQCWVQQCLHGPLGNRGAHLLHIVTKRKFGIEIGDIHIFWTIYFIKRSDNKRKKTKEFDKRKPSPTSTPGFMGLHPSHPSSPLHPRFYGIAPFSPLLSPPKYVIASQKLSQKKPQYMVETPWNSVYPLLTPFQDICNCYSLIWL